MKLTPYFQHQQEVGVFGQKDFAESNTKKADTVGYSAAAGVQS